MEPIRPPPSSLIRWLCEQSLSFLVCSSRWPYRDRTQIGDSVRAQSVMSVHAEQASKGRCPDRSLKVNRYTQQIFFAEETVPPLGGGVTAVTRGPFALRCGTAPLGEPPLTPLCERCAKRRDAIPDLSLQVHAGNTSSAARPASPAVQPCHATTLARNTPLCRPVPRRCRESAGPLHVCIVDARLRYGQRLAIVPVDVWRRRKATSLLPESG